ncbi:MAG: alcohol dehydrogenase [Rhodospirillaceae bacterium]|nr:alcohol dehydrogenase [Rhodospirillaceae bacterium]
MVLRRPFICSTEIHFTNQLEELLPQIIKGRSFVIVTSPFWAKNARVKEIHSQHSQCKGVIGFVEPNPKVSSLSQIAAQFLDIELVIALGGGSVLDTVKGAVALSGLNGDASVLTQHLIQSTNLPDDLETLPIIAIPTTAGTGSEVTPWGTLWGENGEKYSVSHPRLYPEHAVLQPSLTLSMPLELTLSTGLDALSHAMEALWNKQHNPLADLLAERAIHSIYECLPKALTLPQDMDIRQNMQLASLTAGLAMGTTQTALAHSISYPFTATFGIAHGLACSFTLAEIAKYNLPEGPQRLAIAANAFGCTSSELPDLLTTWLRNLGVGRLLSQKTNIEKIAKLENNLINPQRTKNNIRNVSGKMAQRIAQEAFRSLVN